MATRPYAGARPARLVRNKATRWRPTCPRPREVDLETLIQEELSAEVVALSDAVLALLRDHGYVTEPDLTEDLNMEATEMILFAAMNCARRIVGATGLRRVK